MAQSEESPLVRSDISRENGRGFLCRRSQRHSICVKSKAAILVLVWNTLVGLSFGMMLNPYSYLVLSRIMLLQKYYTSYDYHVAKTLAIFSTYGFIAFLTLFYPLAGFLADVKFGRYTIIVSSVLMLVLIIPSAVLVIPLFAAYVAFNANIIQFGLDQLHDSPSEHSSLFIHWFVWTQYIGVGFSQLLASGFLCNNYTTTTISDILVPTAFFSPLVGLAVSLCVGHKYRHRLFLMETGVGNPYKLVYKVLNFAAKHTRPIQRSAFTYCEDELPTRLDLGKDKYGGPFTTEQVEDVKTLKGILLVLLAMSPVFATELAANTLLYIMGFHIQEDLSNCNPFKNLLLNAGSLTPILIVVHIPLYIFLLRPYISRWVPGMLKRIGLGIFLLLLSLVSLFLVDTVGHIKHKDASCMYHSEFYFNGTYYGSNPLDIDSSVLIIPNVLNAVGLVFLYIASYEFLCAQSPHSMKGVLVGAFFAIKGLSQLLGVAILVSFNYWKPQFPSCGFGYYLVNIVIATTGLVVYTLVARGYGYRQRDEPSHANIQQYVEAYYEKTQDEPRYDYSISEEY